MAEPGQARLAQVLPRAEGAAGPGQDDDAHGPVARRATQGGQESALEGRVERIEGVGAIEGQGEDVVGLLAAQGRGVGHRR